MGRKDVSSFGVMLTETCLAIFRWPHLNNHLCVWFTFGFHVLLVLPTIFSCAIQ